MNETADILNTEPVTVDNSEAEQISDTGGYTLSADYTSLLTSVIEKQDKQIELLTEQKAILTEQINGFSIMCNYLHTFVGIFVVSAVVAVLWHILNKWFFRGA